MGAFLLMTVLLAQPAGDSLWLPTGNLPDDTHTTVVSQPCGQLARALGRHYRKDPGIRVEEQAGTVRVVSTRPSDNWSRAALIPVPTGCRIRITPLYRLAPAVVDGAAPGPVTLVIHRHEAAGQQARDMDHLRKRDSSPP